MRLGAAAPAGDQGILGGGDPPDKAQGEVGAHETAENRGGRMLGGGNQMDAGLAPALGEAGEGLDDRIAAGHDQIGKLVDADHDARGSLTGELAAAVADLHGAQERAECLDGLEGIGDDGAGEMGSRSERAEGAALGIDAQQAQGSRGVGETEGGGHSAQEHGLAGAGGAGDEDVGDVGGGEAGEEGEAGVGEAEDGGSRGDGEDIVEEGEQLDGLGIGIGEGEDDAVFVAVDVEGGDAHGEGEVVGEALDGGEAGGGVGVEEEADEAGADGAAGDAPGSAVGGEDRFDAVGLIFQIRSKLLLSHRFPSTDIELMFYFSL